MGGDTSRRIQCTVAGVALLSKGSKPRGLSMGCQTNICCMRHRCTCGKCCPVEKGPNTRWVKHQWSYLKEELVHQRQVQLCLSKVPPPPNGLSINHLT
eukprot:1159322-Pelagomonas_calceolata.AAC.5